MESVQSCNIVEILGYRRYVISNILSFLCEIDGTSFCVSNKKWSHSVLPIFQIHDYLSANNQKEYNSMDQKNEVPRSTRKKRHEFRTMPVQDSIFLLDRINTIRLARRFRLLTKASHIVDIISISEIYPLNMTTEEIAWHEWTQQRNNYVHQNISSNYCWPPKLQLLRYRNPPTQTINNFKSASMVDNLTLTLTLPPKILPKATVLTSYPRSGNTLLRTLLERITGIVTGSDTRPDRTLSKSLSLKHDLVGEGVTNQLLTPVIKTHFPERRGYMTYNAERIILLVRNPYDAIDSYWNMCTTNTHTESVTEEVYAKYDYKFRALARYEFGTWLRFSKYWLEHTRTEISRSEEQSPSILIIRFEDLLQFTEEVLQEVLKFMTGTPFKEDLHGFWKYRIRIGLDLPLHHEHDTTIKIDTSTLGSYIPRTMDKKSNSSIGKSLTKERYSKEDLSFMHELAKQELLQHRVDGEINLLKLFGYDILDQDFPSNTINCTVPLDFHHIYRDGASNAESSKSIVCRVNVGSELRPVNSPYGREMTYWRKSQTKDDTEPFPVQNKNDKIS